MLCWCKDCDGVFKLSEEYLKNNGECPKVGCWGELVEIDELMLPIIRILNRKGYETQYCCSGHVNDSSGMAYICFQAGANPLGDGLTVRQMIEQLGEEQTRKVLRACWEESLELYNQIKNTLPRPWVMELPGAYYWGPSETLGELMQRDQAQGVYKVPRYYMNILGDFINRVNSLYPEDIDNDELNSLLTTIKNQGDEIEMKDKEIVRLKAKVEKMQAAETKLKAKVDKTKAATKKATVKTSVKKTEKEPAADGE